MYHSISILLLSFIVLISCSPKENKREEVLIKELNHTIALLSKKNQRTFEQVEKLYKKDTTEKDIRELYLKLQAIRKAKENFSEEISKEGADHATLSKSFYQTCNSQLTPEEQKQIQKDFKDSPLVNPTLLTEEDLGKDLPYILKLESELMTEEAFDVILKDLVKTKKGFDYDIIWEQ